MNSRGASVPISSRARVLAVMRSHYLARGHTDSEWLTLEHTIRDLEVNSDPRPHTVSPFIPARPTAPPGPLQLVHLTQAVKIYQAQDIAKAASRIPERLRLPGTTYYSQDDNWFFFAVMRNTCRRCLELNMQVLAGNELRRAMPEHWIYDQDTIIPNLHPNCQCVAMRVSGQRDDADALSARLVGIYGEETPARGEKLPGPADEPTFPWTGQKL